MMISCATLSRKVIDRVNCRTDAEGVLSAVRLGSFGCEATGGCGAGRGAAFAIGMHNPRAIHARSITLTLARLFIPALVGSLRRGGLLGGLLLLAKQPVHGANQ